MTKIIKLTAVPHDKNSLETHDVYINAKYIIMLNRAPLSTTTTVMMDSPQGGVSINVKQTPEEIAALISLAQPTIH